MLNRTTQFAIDRRAVLMSGPVLVAISACQQTPRVYEMKVSRDEGCTCCSGWAKKMEETGRFRIAMFDAGDLPDFKRSVGVPPGMGSCHTGLVERYVIEGHVPPEDILRLLEQRPKGVLGLAVPGMPRGSPGMEQANGSRDAFTVFAFEANNVSHEFSTYPAA